MWHWTETLDEFFCGPKNLPGRGPEDRVEGYSPGLFFTKTRLKTKTCPKPRNPKRQLQNNNLKLYKQICLGRIVFPLTIHPRQMGGRFVSLFCSGGLGLILSNGDT